MLGWARKSGLFAVIAAAFTTGTLIAGSGIATADPQIVTITATCDGGEEVTVTTHTNNAAGLVFVENSTSVGVVLSETSSTLGTLRTPPPGFEQNALPTTTCTFTLDFAPQLGTITVVVLFSPAW